MSSSSAKVPASSTTRSAWWERARIVYGALGLLDAEEDRRVLEGFERLEGELLAQAREQFAEMTNGELPDHVAACVGGGSNAMGIFAGFLDDEDVRLVGVEAAGDGIDTGRHAAPLCAGGVGVLHGAKSYLLQTPDGQIVEAHSISAGLDYPGVGPEHAWLEEIGRARHESVDDAEAIEALGEHVEWH